MEVYGVGGGGEQWREGGAQQGDRKSERKANAITFADVVKCTTLSRVGGVENKWVEKKKIDDIILF